VEVPKSNTLDTIKAGTPAMVAAFGYNGFPRGEPVMVKQRTVEITCASPAPLK
jgi:hypothetical protein